MLAAQSRPSVFSRLRSNMATGQVINGAGLPTSPTLMSAQNSQASSPSPMSSALSQLDLLEDAISQAQQSASSIPGVSPANDSATSAPVAPSAPVTAAAPAPVAAPEPLAGPLPVLDTVPQQLAPAAPEPVPAAVSPEPVDLSYSQPPLETVAQAVPTVIAQQTDTLNVPLATSAPKEVWKPPVALAEAPMPVAEATPTLATQETGTSTATIEQAAQPQVEAGASSSVAEFEPASELPVEVEGYLQEVKDHTDQLPQEIVITNNQMSLVTPAAQTLRPVVVLPITPELEKTGAKKNPSWSLRWLVEWSRKLMKAFTGKIIYHQT